MDAEQDRPGGFSLPSWRRTLPPSAAWNTPRACWWVLLPAAPDAPGLGARLLQRLAEAQARVVLITPGPRLAPLEPPFEPPSGPRRWAQHWALPPGEPGDYALLSRRLSAEGLAPDRILHLWSLWPPEAPGPLETAFAQAHEEGFQSLLFLLQALGGQAPRPVSLTVVTHRMQALGEEVPCPERATVLGPVHAAPREWPHLACRSVDVSLPAPGGWQEAQLADGLLAECASPSGGETDGEDVVYRGQQRHVRALSPIALPVDAPEGAARGPWAPRERGVYLVLGGFGTLGASHAEALARRARARLVLVGRTLMPERAQWDAWLETHEEQEPLARRIRQVRALEALGSEVHVVSADVADREQLRGAVEETRARFGALHGVVFCVGTVGALRARPLARLTPEDVRVLFQGRVHGLYALEEVLRDQPLDFCLLSASLAAVQGRGGSAAHAASMYFTDAFALRQSQRSPVPWVSVDWADWGAASITPAEGAELFTHLLSLGAVGQVAAAPRGAPAPARPAPPASPARESSTPAEPVASPADPEHVSARPGLDSPLDTPYVAPRDAVEESIARLWESMLGLTRVGIHDNFFELGGDWRTGVTVVSRVREQHGVTLPPVSLQEGPTVELLARRLRAASEGLPDLSFDRPTRSPPVPPFPPSEDD